MKPSFFDYDRRDHTIMPSPKQAEGWSRKVGLAIALGIFLLGATYLEVRGEPETAHAAVPVGTHDDYLAARWHGVCEVVPSEEVNPNPPEDNRHYCKLIRDGQMKVVGAEGSITSLCRAWGVELDV